MVKFAKNGSDVTTAAVRLARAYTGRDLVAVCEDQPFFSTDDWFIGHTAMPAGIPSAIRDLTVGFRFNDLAVCGRNVPAAPPDRCGRAGAGDSDEPEPGSSTVFASAASERDAPRLRRDDHGVPLA